MKKLKIFLWGFLVFMLINISIFKIYWIPSQSMEDTIKAGDFVYIYKLPYFLNYGQPDYGEILLFQSPLNEKEDYIKRLIAKPGDSIYIKDNQLYLNDQEVLEDYLSADTYMEDFEPLFLSEDEYFFMGDKRKKSQDSRHWGPVEYEKIKGRMIFKIWSPAKDGEDK